MKMVTVRRRTRNMRIRRNKEGLRIVFTGGYNDNDIGRRKY